MPDSLPRSHLVRPKLAIMDACIAKLDAVLTKLVLHSFRIVPSGIHSSHYTPSIKSAKTVPKDEQHHHQYGIRPYRSS